MQTVQTPAMVDVKGVAEILKCHWRHVLLMANTGKMPKGIHIGRMRRWRVSEIHNWIERGCKPVQSSHRRTNKRERAT
ncbi:helix-turn-helix domain-containing protein [Telmatocola sphagniphila]|uniref:Helix-turn-helix domain-containing protein n=1 Tax=Telmatocola sphagniphila TaxID=1123043 RepID=A0A8E6EVU1_9BACT|nr:helix-turn-helix domain-containing protein [Telmatocola sphagniphila]QVL33220.1 helix-turn-helix domain-containing protein [Telmatocola sphagniphila]